MPDQYTFTNPATQYPNVTPPVQQQPEPGLQSRMTPVPDLGEDSYRGTGRLTGRRALITGADSGIGAAVAIAFAREGADIALAYLPDEEEDAQHVVELIRAAGRTAVTIPGDLTDAQYCRDLVAKAVEGLGGLDTIVNVVAPGPTWSVLQVTAGVDPESLPEFGSSEAPMGRAAQPAEQAPAYVFRASAESSYVVGETLNVNGGMVSP